MTSARASQMEQPMAESITIMATELDLNFISQGRPSHWVPDSAETMAQKLNSMILEESGDLHNEAIDVASWSTSGGGTDLVAELVDALGYGAYHVEGTRFMPVRDWTYVSDEALSEIDNIFMDWVTADF